jgi:hypothetical protein
MPASFDNSGKPAYMYDSVGDTWYAFGAKIDTASAYEWTNTQTFLNTTTFDSTVNILDGFNNFLNPAARDAAITSPVHGTICFVRQDAGGNPLNQIQYYSGSAWTANDGDISGVTAGTGLSGGGTAGTITLSVDTAVVATTNNTLTMSNKTLTSPVISSISNTGTLTLPTSTDTLVGRATTDTLTNKTISGSSNTLSNIGNGSLTNSSITINGSSVSLGGSVTISGESFSPFMLMGA